MITELNIALSPFLTVQYIMILRYTLIQRSIISCSIITTIQAAPILLSKRAETGQGQSEPFWISVIAVVSILVAIILGVIIIYCIKTKRKQRHYQEQQPCTTITTKSNSKNNSKISKQINDNDPLGCLHPNQQPTMSNHTGRTGGSDSSRVLIHETSDEELESSRRNRLSVLFFGQPPPPPNRQQQTVKENNLQEKASLNMDDGGDSDQEQLQQQGRGGKQFIKSKKKKRSNNNNNNNNGTWTSAAFASLGRKSVASVQWVGFRASMDRQPQQNTGLFVVNNSNSYYHNNNIDPIDNDSSTDHLAQYHRQQQHQQFRY